MSATQPQVFLVDAGSFDRRLIEEWVAKNHPGVTPEFIRIPPTRAWDAGKLRPELAERLARGDDPILTPIRVAWLPRQFNGERAVRSHVDGDVVRAQRCKRVHGQC